MVDINVMPHLFSPNAPLEALVVYGHCSFKCLLLCVCMLSFKLTLKMLTLFYLLSMLP